MLVRYADDPTLWHLRVVLSFHGYVKYGAGAEAAVVTVCSPDRDVFDLALGKPHLKAWKRLEGRVPQGISTRALYMDKHSTQGRFVAGELETLAAQYAGKKADGSLIPVAPAVGAAAPGAAAADAGPVSLPVSTRLRKKTPAAVARGGRAGGGDQEVAVPGEEAVPVGGLDGEPLGEGDGLGEGTPRGCWGVVLGDQNHPFGWTARLPEGAKMAGDTAILEVPGRLLPIVFRRLFLSECAHIEKKVREELKDLLGAVDEQVTPSDGNDGGAVKDSVGDCRILPVLLDEQGERWRKLEDSVACSTQVEFDDWPLDNVRSTRYAMKERRRANTDWMQSSSTWIRNSGIRATDRACHEHKVISRALTLFQSYDQLCMVNSAGVELLVKRLMLIENAYRGRPEAPRYDGAEYFMGVREEETGEFIDPSVIKFTATKLKSDMEVLRETRLKREEDVAAKKGKGDGKGPDPKT